MQILSSRWRVVLWVKAIADTAYGLEKDRIGGIDLDIAAQAHDEVVDGARVRVFAHAPHLLEQFLARDAASLMTHKITEQVGLHDGETDAAAIDAEFERGEVDGAAGEGEGRFGLGWYGSTGLAPLPRPAAQQAVQPGQQDRDIEWFWQVVVCAGREAAQRILGAAAGYQNQDGRAVVTLAQLLDDGEAVAAGQH